MITERNIIVTGSGGGIGLEIVKRLCEEGYIVSACYRNSCQELNNLSFQNLYKYSFDLNQEDLVITQFKKISENNKGKIFGLVNCAGIAHGGLFNMTPMEKIKEVFQVNYFSQLLLLQLVSKKLIRFKEGAIVNIASTAGIFADEGTLAYGSSKAAFIHSTKVLAMELGKFNIRVNSISPAVVNTQMSSLMSESSLQKLNSRKSIQGSIQPSDIASLVSYLLSDQAKFISGQNIRIDQAMYA